MSARTRGGRAGPRALLLPALLVLLTGAARADDGGAAPKGPVETIEVRGSADDAAVLDTTAFATVIRAEDFADRITSVPELLRDLVGVQVRGLGGELATVSIRGSSAEQVMVYLDGVPLNRALGGGVNLADLPLGQVESIEVYRGFTPAGLPVLIGPPLACLGDGTPCWPLLSSTGATLRSAILKGAEGPPEGVLRITGTLAPIAASNAMPGAKR